MTKNQGVRVRLDQDQMSKLRGLSQRTGTPVTTLVRKSIDMLISASSGGTPDELRRQMSSEFVFLAMRRWAEENLETETDELLAEARRRTEALYASV
jgi:hypothetical protein